MNEKEGEKDGYWGEDGLSRREFLKLAGLAGATVGIGVGLGGLAAGCGGETATTTTTASATTAVTTPTASTTSTTVAASTTTASAGPEAGRDLKIGIVSPDTGSLASFALGVDWSIQRLNEALKGGITCGDGKQHKLQVITRDTQSDAQRAAAVTAELIQSDKVDMVLSSGAPDTVNPSADICETMACPSLSSASPWQAFYFERNPPETGFTWTYGILIGSELTMACFTEMFDQIPNNKIVGMLFANDADAAGWMAENAAPAVFEAKGYTLVNPTWYTPGAEDFTVQISEFKKRGCEILCGSNNPPEFTNFWKQAVQQGFRPKLASSGKALLFPQTLEAIGPTGNGLLGEVGWHRTFPYKDSITGASCEELAVDYEAKTGVTYNPSIIGAYCLLEWAVDAFKRAQNLEDKASIVEAIRTTNMVSAQGSIDLTAPIDPMSFHPVPNVVKPPTCGGQWLMNDENKFEAVICSNAAAPDVAVQAKVQPMVY